MTFLRLTLILACLVVSASGAWAQDYFIGQCQTQDTLPAVRQTEFKWLKQIFKTNDCKNLAEKISNVESFNDIIPSSTGSESGSWMEDFPLLRYDSLIPIRETFQDGSPYRAMFRDLDVFSEFPKLRYLSFLDFHGDVCSTLKKLPQLKLIRIDERNFFKAGVDECIAGTDIEVILGDFIALQAGNIVKNPKSKIVGIVGWNGSLKPLTKFRNLRYLSINQHMQTNGGLEVLAPLINLTHLNIRSMYVQELENLRYLPNLEFLSLSCSTRMTSSMSFSCKSGSRPDATSKLNDLKFLRPLKWIRHLELSDFSIKDISEIQNLQYLEHLDLESNNLAGIPDLSMLKDLKYLNLSNNQISSLSGILDLTSVEFLHLAGNGVRDFSQLNIPTLKYLNISRNPFQDLTLGSMPELQILAINGRFAGYERSNSPTASFINQTLSDLTRDERNLVRKVLSDGFTMNISEECTIFPSVKSISGLENQKNLLMLSITAQNLKSSPSFEGLEKLRYLDISMNALEEMPELNVMPSLKIIDTNGNSKISLIPEGVKSIPADLRPVKKACQ
ncbi:MAG: leucine-rich repeat domain-containing protein [Bdellovibrionota bacterium]